MLESPTWWRDAVIYQVYPRSFADSDADGMGDIRGIISRLDYLTDLGVDALWISPFYTSPLHDGGYDVADYREVDPRLGSSANFQELIDQAHARGLRIFMDIVPNHTSSEHAWFKEAIAAGPGSPEWDRYIIRPGKGENGELPPNNWKSVFHGRGWSHMRTNDGKETGYWYLHLFDTTQPDVNWENREVHEEFLDVLRYWFDRGVDGFRIDVAHGLVKDPALPDIDDELASTMELLGHAPTAPYWDQDGVHEIYKEWRRLADSYDPPRVFCGETWAPSPERLALYQRPDELHTSFNFNYLEAGWDAERLKESIDATIANHAKVGAPPTWVLSNHDIIRHRTRLAPGFDDKNRLTCVVDEEIGLARARAATLFLLALPGSAYIYQGEELGLTEVRDLAPEDRQDPAWHRSAGKDGMRDGCRVPIPWESASPSYGFGASDKSWLPMPPIWAELALDQQRGVEGSTWEMYRQALALRKAEPALGEGLLVWDVSDSGVLSVVRTSDHTNVRCVLNTTDTAIHLPTTMGTDVLMASGPDVAEITEDAEAHLVIGANTAVWLRA